MRVLGETMVQQLERVVKQAPEAQLRALLANVLQQCIPRVTESVVAAAYHVALLPRPTWLRLNGDVLRQLLTFISAKDIGEVARVCRKWCFAANRGVHVHLPFRRLTPLTAAQISHVRQADVFSVPCLKYFEKLFGPDAAAPLNLTCLRLAPPLGRSCATLTCLSLLTKLKDVRLDDWAHDSWVWPFEWPNLTCLSLNTPRPRRHLTARWPSLTTLTLVGWHWRPPTGVIVPCHASLVTLDIAAPTEDDLVTMLTHAPCLVNLHVRRWMCPVGERPMTSAVRSALSLSAFERVGRCHALEELALDCPLGDTAEFGAVLGALTKLARLELTIRCEEPVPLQLLALSMPSLTRLTFVPFDEEHLRDWAARLTATGAARGVVEWQGDQLTIAR